MLRLRRLFFIIAMILCEDSAFALQVSHSPELWVMGKIQNQSFINLDYKLKFTAYNSTLLPAMTPEGFIADGHRTGEFRISTQVNSHQAIDLSYQTIVGGGYNRIYDIEEHLCRFTLQVDAKGLTHLSVKTLDGSYLQCGVSQDAQGTWVITLTNPSEIN